MNRILPSTISILFACGALALASTTASAAGRCDPPKGTPDVRACAKAALGGGELRRFVERTRGIYGLSWYDYAPADRTKAAAAPADEEPVRVARAR